MTKFRPCIDIHAGVVKQIVGGTLSDDNNKSNASSTSSTATTTTTSQLVTNYTSPHPASYFADLYRKHNLTGAHVIMLGPGCTDAARDALQSWPNGLQVGGGITAVNAKEWIERGAEKIIITSYLFPDAKFSLERLEEVERLVGKDRLVVDVSCRRKDNRWFVAMNKWQTLTDTEVTNETLALLAEHCSEFLIHAADVEGLCKGIDMDLVEALGKWVTIPTTYAGGAYSLQDLDTVERLSEGKVDLTYGSALDIFGGSKVDFMQCVEWNNKNGVV